MADCVVVHNFINGRFVEPKRFIDSYDPSIGRVWALIPDSDEDEVEQAVRAANDAFPKWSNTSAQERSRLMLKIADILESKLDELALTESRDQGKPVSLAKAFDIPRCVHNFRFFASYILHALNKSSYQPQFSAINYTCQMPVGVAGLISPWNLPLYLLTFKIAPALAAGDTVVCKPSEMTSVTAWMLCKILNEAGVPAGVVNMVFGVGSRAGEAIVKHPDVPLLSFTGSTVTGTHIQRTSAHFCKKLSLELGGKNAAVIFDDCNMEKCVETTVRSSFANQGEICLCTSRIFVQEGIYEEFVKKFVEKTRIIKVGDPRNADTQCGALISKEHLAKVKGYVKVALEEGGAIQCGDGIDELDLPEENAQGYFMRPTVITGLQDTSRLMQEEIFGPVTCIVPFETEEEVIPRANGVKYGLCAALWTQNMDKAHRVARRLQVGTVWSNCWLVRDLNMPFGGMKASGIGREGGYYSLEFFTEEKTVCIQTG